MRTPTRYARSKLGTGLPVPSLLLAVTLLVAIGVMIWSLRIGKMPP